MRSDVIRMYREIHSWVGIISGLFLFIAFYAGAVSMFETSLQRWASAPVSASHFTALDKTPELMRRVFEQHPLAQGNSYIILAQSPEEPNRMRWEERLGSGDHAEAGMHSADLDTGGNVVVNHHRPLSVAQVIDDLHQQVGVLLDHDIAMLIAGLVSLLYGLALVSGLIILLPTLVKDLFAVRLGKKLKRMWLDIHNVLGLFSLPFHLVMALTAVVFTLHDQFYDSQDALIYPAQAAAVTAKPTTSKPTTAKKTAAGKPLTELLAPGLILENLRQLQPEFEPSVLNYRQGRDGQLMLYVNGTNPRHHANRATGGSIQVNPYSGDIVTTDYMPGTDSGWHLVVSSFFALHFGSYGGNFIRWCYFLLGLAGAFLFYSGNLLWLEVRRKKSRLAADGTPTQQSRSSRLLAALTVGISLGCVSGISVMIASAKLMPGIIETIVPGAYGSVYYLIFFTALAWAFGRGAARSAVELLVGAAVCTALIPAVSLLSLGNKAVGWNHLDSTVWVDVIAVIASLAFFKIAQKAAVLAPNQSVWR